MKSKTTFTERGQALIVIALAAVVLFGFMGLAIDGSAKFSDRRHAQNAADTAVLAASLAKLRGDTSWKVKGLDRALSNGYDDNLVNNTVTVYSCDETGSDCASYAGKSKYVKVVIVSHVSTYFARIVGINQLDNVVQAVAYSSEEYTGQLYNGAAFVGLAQDQCKTIWLHGSAGITIQGGGLFSNSNQDCGVTIAGASGFNVTMDGAIDMAANAYTKSGNPPLGGIAGGITGGSAPYDYPPDPDTLPSITCSGTATKTGSSMSPGNYSGTFPPNGVNTLQPGTYCLTGNFNMTNGTLTGTGVTIYLQGNSSGLSWNGNAQIDLSAPTSGDLAGMLIYAPMTNSSDISINGTASTTLTGTILAPASNITYNGTGNINPSHVQVIGYTINITGSNSTNVIYQDGDNWDTNIPAKVGLMK
jgi:Flp pilus assembly protein TadG